MESAITLTQGELGDLLAAVLFENGFTVQRIEYIVPGWDGSSPLSVRLISVLHSIDVFKKPKPDSLDRKSVLQDMLTGGIRTLIPQETSNGDTSTTTVPGTASG